MVLCRYHCTMHGITVTVVAPCGVMVMVGVIVLLVLWSWWVSSHCVVLSLHHVVLWSQLLCHMVSWFWWVSLHHMWCHGYSHCAVCCGHAGVIVPCCVAAAVVVWLWWVSS